MNTISSQTFKFDRETMTIIREIAQDLNMSDIEVIRNGLKVMSLYADLKKKEGRILVQAKQGEPTQELSIPSRKDKSVQELKVP